MARHLIKSDVTIRNTKPKDKPFRISDGDGLYLLVNPDNTRWWRLDYSITGKRKTLSVGVYPKVGLAGARSRADEARQMVAAGTDPSDIRKAKKERQEKEREAELRISQGLPPVDSFEEIAREWFAKFSPGWVASHSDKIMSRLERDIFPWLGRKPIAEVKAPALLETLRRIEHRGAAETAHRALQNCGQIFRYAIASGKADSNPADALKGALAPVNPEHHASITDPAKVGELLRAIRGYQGSFTTQCALKLAPLVFVRPGELRNAEWAEIDLDGAEWRIPAEKMKMRAVHIVPLSAQAVAILRELQPLTGRGRFVFPGVRDHDRPMSENTVNAALRRLGYSNDEMTGHGFRSMASTILNEQGWHRDAIERQLAHAERDSVRAAYNYAEHLPERKRMMQAWADYLDGLAAGGVVISINRRSA